MGTFIAHLVNDEKFIDMAYRQFADVSMYENRFFILAKTKKLRFIKTTPVEFISSQMAIKVMNSDECKAVILHSLHPKFVPLLNFIPKNIPVIWFGLGYDYYKLLLKKAYPKGLLLPQTKRVLLRTRLSNFLSFRHGTFKGYFLNLVINNLRGSINRINYFSPVLDTEYQIAIKHNPWFRAKFLCWNYGSIENDLSDSGQENVNLGNNVLIGNSATPENNHVEIFEKLRNIDGISNKKIVVPLSYGDEKYRNEIIKIGRNYFGDNFVPLLNFLTKEEYLTLLNSCGYVFMNHIRQQAVGNIVIMMIKGAKIFINSDSPTYQWFYKQGAVIYPINDNMIDSIWNELTVLDKKKNYDVAYKNWGKINQEKKTINLLNLISKYDEIIT